MQEISDFLTEPFRHRAGAGGPPSGAVASSAPVGVNNTNNSHLLASVDSVGRNLDALNLAPAQAPAPAAGAAADPLFPHLKEKSWFYGAITRNECDNLLNQYGQDGDFLVRSSETNVGDYSVSLKAPGRNKHFRVHVEGALYVIGQRRLAFFENFSDSVKDCE